MSKKKRKLSSGRYNEAYDSKDKGGSSRQQFIDWKKCAEDKPKFFSPREGTNKINIIPFEIKSKNHPLVKSGRMEIGDLDFVLDIYAHRYVGPSNADVVCPKKNYGKSCPICDMVSEYYDKGKKDEAKSLQASRRVLLNVQPIIRGEVGELQVFDASHFKFMKELIEEAHECSDGEDIVAFADIESGKIVKFRMSEQPFGKNTMQNFKSFDFLDREEELDDNLVDQAISFDEGLVITSAEDIEKVLYGQDEDEDDDNQSAKKKDKRKDDDDDDEPERKKKKRDKDGDNEDDDEPEHKKKPKRDKDEDEDDEPKKDKSSKKGKCPEGHRWGEADEHKECKKCPLWDDCVEA